MTVSSGATPARVARVLDGVTVVELAGSGPVPFAATMLADLGARVIRIDRPGAAVSAYPRAAEHDVLGRGRESIVLDLKRGGAAIALRLIDRADAFVEGLRPGVAERLGIGPQICLEANPRLVYGRVSGWGRSGPWAERAGHDVNFIAVGGALASVIGRDGTPALPLSLLGDFGGGGMCLALGVLSGLVDVARNGRGRVVDTSILDAVATLMAPMWGIRAEGDFDERRPGTNIADGGAPFYGVYRCADGRYLALGAIEEPFRRRLAGLLGTPAVLGPDPRRWPAERAELEALFAGRSCADWTALLEDADACVSPVLGLGESADHPQFAERERFEERGGVRQPRPPWTVDDEPLAVPTAAPARGQDGAALLRELGCDDAETGRLIEAGAVHLASP